ncbi:MAG: peptidylprolyl isomerase [Oscillospiraceae bacterium]|nr:peptidylprolyl isomerase [Oscillospiraceae bacterium]
MKYKVFAALVSAVMLTAFTGCQKEIEIKELPILNYTAPAEGEEIVVIHVKDMGDIKIKLFPELLPEACENFTTLAKNGYYDELIFHRVIEGFMIQGGDPKGDGTGGESCWGGKFNGGVNEQLIHVPGALAYANSAGPTTDGSQFYIVTGAEMTQEDLDYYESEDFAKQMMLTYDINFTKEAQELYKEHGGAPHLDGGYTVFGQVIEGLDIVYAISQVDVTDRSKPKQAVYMESITVEPYDGSEIHWYKSDYGME